MTKGKYGVYCVINNINLKMYIGKGIASKRLYCSRWNSHRKADTLIGRAIRKYGVNRFTFGWLAVGLSEEQAFLIEVQHIAFWKTNVHKHGWDYGYNQTDGGEGASGRKHSLEYRQMMKERTPTEAEAANYRAWQDKRVASVRERKRQALQTFSENIATACMLRKVGTSVADIAAMFGLMYYDIYSVMHAAGALRAKPRRQQTADRAEAVPSHRCKWERRYAVTDDLLPQ